MATKRVLEPSAVPISVHQALLGPRTGRLDRYQGLGTPAPQGPVHDPIGHTSEGPHAPWHHYTNSKELNGWPPKWIQELFVRTTAGRASVKKIRSRPHKTYERNESHVLEVRQKAVWQP